MPISRRQAIAGVFAAPLFSGPLLARSAQAAPNVNLLPLNALISATEENAPAIAQPVAPPAHVLPVAGDASTRWRHFAVPARSAHARPVISIIIDDMGVMHGTARAAALPGPLTLSWFPFAPSLPDQLTQASMRGHEALLHMPMQTSSNSIAQTGPNPLRIDRTPEENRRLLQAAFAAVPNAVGLNNHMGTVATRDPALMSLVAGEVSRAGMLLLDSLTIGHSCAYTEAAQIGVVAGRRDVFIDDVQSKVATLRQLELVEQVARRSGSVIAIGHPHPTTLEALEEWLPRIETRGFTLWPLSATLAWRNGVPIPWA